MKKPIRKPSKVKPANTCDQATPVNYIPSLKQQNEQLREALNDLRRKLDQPKVGIALLSSQIEQELKTIENTVRHMQQLKSELEGQKAYLDAARLRHAQRVREFDNATRTPEFFTRTEEKSLYGHDA